MQPTEQDQQLPFECYTKTEDELLKPIWKGGNCRRGYGLEYIRKTGLFRCAYCGVKLNSNYRDWLTMVLDHAIPVSVCGELKIEDEFCRSLANAVLSCAACNGFCNRYKPTEAAVAGFIEDSATFQDRLDLRDRIFRERKRLILSRHEDEKKFFKEKVDGRPTSGI